MAFQRYGHSKLYKTVDGLDLGFGPTGSTEVETFNPPTRKPYHRTKREVDRMTRCRDMAVRNFPKCEVGRSSVLNIYIDVWWVKTHSATKLTP